MIKKITKIILVVLIIILLKLLFSYTINSIVIKQYNEGKYNTSLIKYLYFININQPYLPYYNEGTIHYQLKEYDEAIELFNKALKKNPGKNQVCDIRINLSLSMLAKIDYNNKEQALNELKAARNVLYEDNCANQSNDNGNSEDAEKLEDEIKEKEEELNQNNNGKDDDDNKNDDNKNDDDNEVNEQEIEEKLKEQQQQGIEERNDDLDYIENRENYNGYEKDRW